jgi:SAM-dependent methyltransferase
MAIAKDFFKVFQKYISEVYPETEGLKVLELGDQIFSRNNGKDFIAEGYDTGKDYFTKFYGMDHTSVDLNGEHGSLVKDLRKEEDFKDYKNHFDILTNFGTIEHVDPAPTQWTAWKIVHESLKPNGLYLHVAPGYDHETNRVHPTWRAHCNNHYCREFFYNLAEKQNYEILHYSMIRDNNICVMIKKEDNEFTIESDDLLTYIHSGKK